MRKGIYFLTLLTAFQWGISNACAGGLYLYELGTEDMGLANAGSAARAQDASVIASNPAGMTRLQGNQITLGAQLLYGDFDYTMNDSGQTGPGNVIGWLPGASTFYSHSVSDDLKVGLGLFGNYGLSLSFDDAWAGHNLVKETTLMGLTLQPSMAYRLNDKWSMGGGVGINYGIFSLKRDKALLGGRGEVEQDDSDIAYNVKMGLLFEPSKRNRFGLVYVSKVDYSFQIDATGTLPITGRPWSIPVTALVDAPQHLMLSGVHGLNDTWSLLGEIGWQDWSTFSEAEIRLGNITRSSALHLQDTWHGAVGIQYQMTDATRLNFGIAYDTSMYDNQEKTSFVIPGGAAWRFGTGLHHRLNEKSSFGVAFEYLDSESAASSSPRFLAGRYEDPSMCFFALYYSNSF